MNSVSQVFQQSVQRVVGLGRQVREEPSSAEDLAQLSADARRGFVAEVVGLTAFSAEDSRRSALQALAAGLLCGALDGVILLETGRMPLAGPSEGPPALPLPSFDRNLEQAVEVARDNWALMSADELQLLSGYGKHQNGATAEEAEAVAARGDLAEGQTFLLATFKAGYALGLIDSVIVCRTGEVPGQPAAPGPEL